MLLVASQPAAGAAPCSTGHLTVNTLPPALPRVQAAVLGNVGSIIIFRVGGDDAVALELFDALAGARYDYLGVLGFGLPVRGDADRLYCFEWCALAMGVEHQRWMTPEKLLLAAWGRP